jgi:2-polyprenyl-6-methoxyphenol hydroxylase-like FAD-dependent oxidoreductase
MKAPDFSVLVGGAGIAAAATSLRLIKLGIPPLIVCTSTPIQAGIEAIPEVAVPLFAELGMLQVLSSARATIVEGFENDWDDREIVRSGLWFHVDRRRLAEAAMREAVRQGATLRTAPSLPKLTQANKALVADLDGRERQFDAVIDATGRSAVWSRPTRRHGMQVADLYSLAVQESTRGRIGRAGQGWAYRIGLDDETTVAIMSSGKRRRKPTAGVFRTLGLVETNCVYRGRRPAFPQWAEQPVEGRRLSVGDAALAYDPIAGQGIRFALSSALAVATVVNTWRYTPTKTEAANRFYLDFIARARQRHLQFVDAARMGTPAEPFLQAVPDFVVFRGETGAAELQIGSRIVRGTAVRLHDGSWVRWVGGVDLLRLRDLAHTPVRSSDLARKLASSGIDVDKASTIMAWCAREGLLALFPGAAVG